MSERKGSNNNHSTPVPDNKKVTGSLSRNIKTLRERRNMSRVTLAELLNLDVYTIGYYERGDSEPSVDMLIKISDVFHVTVDELVGKKSELPVEMDIVGQAFIRRVSQIYTEYHK